MVKLMQNLEILSPKQKNNKITFTIPVVLHTGGILLNLQISQKENSYTICCPDNLFLELNAKPSISQKYYFNIFEKHDKNHHYNITLNKKGLFFKEYSNEFNVRVAVNEFIRFYILLDDFIINNNVIGHEEDFE